MEKLNFSKNINASKQKVWDVLWNDETYRAWTSVFSEGSHAESDWNEGSQILFLGSERSGMVSRIEKKSPPDFMSFKHLGMTKDGKEVEPNEETSKWSGALENYTLTETDGGTKLTVEMDMNEDMSKYFNETFPKALAKVKELAEQ